MQQLLLLSRVLLLNLEKEKCSTTQRHMSENQKDTQERLGKLRFDLDSSSNTNAIQKTVKQFTEITSECGDKTLRIKKRGKVNKKPKKPWHSENCTLLRKQFTRVAKLLQKDSKNPYIMGQYQIIKKSYKQLLSSFIRR